jgi:hypothetical protein
MSLAVVLSRARYAGGMRPDLWQASAFSTGRMVSLEFSGLGAGEIERCPEVETLLVTGYNRTEAMRKVLNRVAEKVN